MEFSPSPYIHYTRVRKKFSISMASSQHESTNNNVDLPRTFQSILDQLTVINNTLQTQETRLGQLETRRGAQSETSRTGEASQTGGDPERTPPQERSAPEAQMRDMETLIQRLLRDNNREIPPLSQH